VSREHSLDSLRPGGENGSANQIISRVFKDRGSANVLACIV
jgi:hypothetical protein